MVPLIAAPGRLAPEAPGLRGPVFALGQKYMLAIHRAGGREVMLPPIADRLDDLTEVMARFDGLLLHGGGDIDPACYGAIDRHETLYGVVAEHDAVELAALRAALAIGLPILAICRGHQLLNVALGGSLHQHILSDADEVKHRFEFHSVDLAPGCKAALALGTETPHGHSVHHQAIDRLGAGLRVTGRSADGTVEAIELEGPAWVVGVQWHPEDSAADDPVQQRLFDSFVTECARWAQARDGSIRV